MTNRPQRVAKSRSSWRVGVARHLVRPIAAEWPLLKLQRSVASQGDERQVSAAAFIGLQNLTDCSQPQAGTDRSQASLQRLQLAANAP